MQTVKIAIDHRYEVGVDDRGAGALEFPRLSQYVVRDTDGHVRKFVRREVSDRLLVFCVRVGVEQTYRDIAHACRANAELLLRLVPVERLEDLAPGRDPFVELEPQPSRDQRLGFHPFEVVHVAAPAAAPDLEDVGEARCGKQSHLRAARFQDGVGCDRSAVDEAVDIRAGEPEFVEHFA